MSSYNIKVTNKGDHVEYAVVKKNLDKTVTVIKEFPNFTGARELYEHLRMEEVRKCKNS